MTDLSFMPFIDLFSCTMANRITFSAHFFPPPTYDAISTCFGLKSLNQGVRDQRMLTPAFTKHIMLCSVLAIWQERTIDKEWEDAVLWLRGRWQIPLIDSRPSWPCDHVSDRGCGTMPLSEHCEPDAVGNATLRWCNTNKLDTIPLRRTRPRLQQDL